MSRSVEDLDIGFVPSRPLLRLRSCLLLPTFFLLLLLYLLALVSASQSAPILHHKALQLTAFSLSPPTRLSAGCPLWTNYCIVAAFKTSAVLIPPYLLSQALSLGYYCQDISGLCITADLSVTHLSCPTGAHLDPAPRLFSFREYLSALTVFLSLLDIYTFSALVLLRKPGFFSSCAALTGAAHRLLNPLSAYLINSIANTFTRRPPFIRP